MSRETLVNLIRSLDTLLNTHLSKEVITLVISALPGFGLSISLPVAIHVLKLSWYYAFFLSVLGNMLPVPFLLLCWDGLEILLGKVSIFRRPLGWLRMHSLKNSSSIEKWGILGLMIFVAIPAPVTGAATASLVAVILGMTFWDSFWAILWGVIISAVIITCLCLLGWFGAAVAGVGLISLSAISILKKKPPKK
jgi:uncharacterized membrane protein